MAVFLYQWWLLFVLSSGLFNPVLNGYDAKKTGNAHPFYVSVTEINHNVREKRLEITCKIFADDMEAVLKQNYKTAVVLSDEKQHTQNNQFINQYITHHLALAADSRKVPLAYVGFEKEAESVYCYFEVTNIPSVRRLEVTNSLLQDYTDKQINILHAVVGSTRKSYKLNFPDKQASFNF